MSLQWRLPWVQLSGSEAIPDTRFLLLNIRWLLGRGDFLEIFEALALLDPDSVRPDTTGEASGPAAV